MANIFRYLLITGVLAGLVLPWQVFAGPGNDSVKDQVNDLSAKAEDTESRLQQMEKKLLGNWLTISGDYQFRYDFLRGSSPAYSQFDTTAANAGALVVPMAAQSYQADSLFSNRFGLNLHVKALENVTVTTRFLMTKIAGAQDDSAINGTSGAGPFFADRAGLFDGTIGHVPGSSLLDVDRAYATWNNILNQPIWISVGRRPSTGGPPSHLKQNRSLPGSSGVPALLVDYAFDGVTLGFAPDITALPGAYLKACYGRGFQNGITTDAGNGLHNTDMVGIQVVPYETDKLRAEFQYNRGMRIFNTPIMLSGPFQGSTPTVNLGDIDWIGADFLGRIKNVGIGNLHWFADGGISITRPNTNTVGIPTVNLGTIDSGSGLLWSGTSESKTGWAAYAGLRYDIEKTGTKIGFEYNHGSKNWITFVPAADDIWTAKLGVRGNVFEGYLIQELKFKPISSYLSKVFFRVGYQFYDFDFTGSNNWVGAPVSIADLGNPVNAQMLTPIKSAHDLYSTFEVHF